MVRPTRNRRLMDNDTLRNQQVKNETEDISFEKNVRTLFRNLNPVIQTFLSGPEREQLLSELKTTYRLVGEPASIFERDCIFMLLGIMEPVEFQKSLGDAGVPKETVDALLNDLNSRIFVPLSEKMQKQGEPRPTPAKTTPAPGIPVLIPKPPLPPVRPNTTPLIKSYAVDPYREHADGTR